MPSANNQQLDSSPQTHRYKPDSRYLSESKTLQIQLKLEEICAQYVNLFQWHETPVENLFGTRAFCIGCPSIEFFSWNAMLLYFRPLKHEEASNNCGRLQKRVFLCLNSQYARNEIEIRHIEIVLNCLWRHWEKVQDWVRKAFDVSDCTLLKFRMERMIILWPLTYTSAMYRYGAIEFFHDLTLWKLKNMTERQANCCLSDFIKLKPFRFVCLTLGFREFTCPTSAPVASHNAEIALIEEILCAKNALAVSLDNSALHKFAVRICSSGTHCWYTLFKTCTALCPLSVSFPPIKTCRSLIIRRLSVFLYI